MSKMLDWQRRGTVEQKKLQGNDLKTGESKVQRSEKSRDFFLEDQPGIVTSVVIASSELGVMGKKLG